MDTVSTGSIRGNYGIELIELIDPFRLMERGLFRIVGPLRRPKKGSKSGDGTAIDQESFIFAKCPRCQKLKNFDFERERGSSSRELKHKWKLIDGLITISRIRNR